MGCFGLGFEGVVSAGEGNGRALDLCDISCDRDGAAALRQNARFWEANAPIGGPMLRGTGSRVVRFSGWKAREPDYLRPELRPEF